MEYDTYTLRTTHISRSQKPSAMLVVRDVYIVACQRGGVSIKPVARIPTRHTLGPWHYCGQTNRVGLARHNTHAKWDVSFCRDIYMSWPIPSERLGYDSLSLGICHLQFSPHSPLTVMMPILIFHPALSEIPAPFGSQEVIQGPIWGTRISIYFSYWDIRGEQSCNL